MKTKNIYIFVTRDHHSSISQNLKAVGLLGEKYDFFFPLEFQMETNFHDAGTTTHSEL